MRHNLYKTGKCVHCKCCIVGNEHYTFLTLLFLPISLSSGPCICLLDRSLHLKQSVSQMNKVSLKTMAKMTNRAGHTHTHTHTPPPSFLPSSPLLLSCAQAAILCWWPNTESPAADMQHCNALINKMQNEGIISYTLDHVCWGGVIHHTYNQK